MYAYCFASGQIFFGKRTSKGALPIAKGPGRRLREIITAQARHGWDRDEQNGPTLLVPGIPEAPSEIAKLEALEEFIKRVANSRDRPFGIAVFPRAHRWPIAGKGKA